MKLTNNERIALNMIALNDYQPSNGGRPESFEDTSAVWSNCLDCHASPESIDGRTLSAACASLAKKGLVETYNDLRTKAQRRGDIDGSTIALTRSGYAAWLFAYPTPVKTTTTMYFVVEVTANDGVSVDDVVEAVGSMFSSSAEAVASARQITEKQARRIR